MERSLASLPCLLAFLFALILFTSTVTLIHGEEEEEAPASAPKIDKLRIGVKKRPETCPTKSKKGDSLSMHYTGTLHATGEKFDSSLDRSEPFVFTLGTGQVIKGWDQGLLGMCEGEKRRLVIPADMGYGERGSPPKIPGGSVLVFEVELLKIDRKGGEL